MCAERRHSDFQELKDEYFANLNAAKAKPVEKSEDKGATTTKPKKLVPKKKVEEDPFASNDEGDDDEKEPKAEAKHIARAGVKRTQDSDDEGDQRPKKKGGKK